METAAPIIVNFKSCSTIISLTTGGHGDGAPFGLGSVVGFEQTADILGGREGRVM